jgi:hypothetical protein
MVFPRTLPPRPIETLEPLSDYIPLGGLVVGGHTMSIIQQILHQREAERRSVGRTVIDRNALLFFTGQTGVFSCCVRDVTNHGAGIRLEGLNVLPVDFDLSFDNFRTVRKCRLIWRDGDFVGVAFK